MSFLFLLFSKYPHFWEDIEQEMNIKTGDIDLAKSIFTALGFMTRETVAELKTKKRVTDLEKDFLKIRGNFDRYKELCDNNPLLKHVDNFAAGIEACLVQIVHFLNSTSDNCENTAKKILDDAKEICNDIRESDISFDTGSTGSRCRIICPKCIHTITLGRFLNNSTGKSTYNIYNFSRHYKKMHHTLEPIPVHIIDPIENGKDALDHEQIAQIQNTQFVVANKVAKQSCSVQTDDDFENIDPTSFKVMLSKKGSNELIIISLHNNNC